ncbi:peptidoglycan recognition protein 1-like [Liolophura sinensis]|uniref:peptidoglycan recognition protein 1-like n=1 Tax=Liolophura sinensis TaxID=3198878 RepID=UPI0031593FAC
MQWEKEVCGGRRCRWTKMDLCCTVLCLISFVVTLIVVFVVYQGTCDVTITTRAEWEAREPRDKEIKDTAQVGIVIIHHTSRAHCEKSEDCATEMRKLQDFHMDERGWDDIAYNFLVGEDGSVYEARGWKYQGAHTFQWNAVSIGIAVMGNFQQKELSQKSMDALRSLITCGVTKGFISPDYKLYGRRDMNPNTTSPGDKLYAQIKTWQQFDTKKPVHPYKAEV